MEKETLIFEALGAASMCWIPSPGNQVFDFSRCKQIGDSLIAALNALECKPETAELPSQPGHLQHTQPKICTDCQKPVGLIEHVDMSSGKVRCHECWCKLRAVGI
jgi:hypothetical protein